ncbi:DUF1194 domain-containing protein [Sneathiella glossodoripedis]|uniref:DUF1194 domain-containing protein n=1 Tax=Sneathiella glossodoripedis TaxID=418853 RepID=UPI0004702179|nr:DUF1194 domain-containing protein [Sneathiella glossodoripedis]
MKVLWAICCILTPLILSLRPALASNATIDLQLVLAVDVSSSVNYDEFDLQMRGYVSAFRSREVKEAISSGLFGHIRVCLIQWAGSQQQEVSIGWTDIKSASDADEFAKKIEYLPRAFDYGGTAIAPALRLALKQLQSDPVLATRQVIDISGDGRVSMGAEPSQVRGDILDFGIIINGLPISNEEPDLSVYYKNFVIGGIGSFTEEARDYSDFSRAIQKKLAREIRGEFIGM